MSISKNSITFRTLFILFTSSTIFILFIGFTAQYIFSNGYKKIISEKIDIIKQNITPSIALNLSYGFNDALDEICNSSLSNPDILLIKVESDLLTKTLSYSSKTTIQNLDSIISSTKLIDPATSKPIGIFTIIYSNNEYNIYMKEFHSLLFYGVLAFIIALLFLGYYIYNSLIHLKILASKLETFNPTKPQKIKIEIDSKDEVASIALSANIMITNIIEYIRTSKELNNKLLKNKKTIEHLAYYDSLTKLPNRVLLKDRINQAIHTAKRENNKIAVIFLDLDHFKLINDTLGHSMGDELLIYVSNLLGKQIREMDTLARIGGDEFVILMPHVHSADDAQCIAEKLLQSLQGQHSINTHQLYITTSIGISIFPDTALSMDELITNADTAMYDAKQDGRNRYKIYSKDMGNYISTQMSLEQDLKKAISNANELEMFYQVKIDTKSKKISGAEALIRWNHPQKGLLFPDEFIGIAESTGMILEMGSWIIVQAIKDLKEWNKKGYIDLKIAINLSPRQFLDKNLMQLIDSLIKEHNINPSQLEFEVTETMSMSNIEATLRTLKNLKNLGVTIAIDDFGTGYSSLSYLKKFPVDTLKIDKSFVMDMTNNEEDRAIVETIISMAHTLGFKTVAEGVETHEHTQILTTLGCDYLQGYYYSKAIQQAKFTEFLENYTPIK